ncbi:MAG: quinolinate synthase NadA [Neisseria sp.]|nr:quinolinate synthase NadA [Neisseria sp.]
MKQHTIITPDYRGKLPENYVGLDEAEMIERIRRIKLDMGEALFIPCHHYQKDEVVQFADATGDSLQLARLSAQNRAAQHIVFCGVHFMAETADILTAEAQQVYLPDMRAGCTMADMAGLEQTEIAWEALQEMFGDTLIPLTYVNSTAEVKAFVGRHGGACVTSGNAKKMVQWALNQKKRLLFLPDRHLGRNTAFALGIPLSRMAEWHPQQEKLSEVHVPLEDLSVILWHGHCAVHERFTLEHVAWVRQQYPQMKVIVHPECAHEVVAAADEVGSTQYIIDTLAAAPAGAAWAIGTEMNLVNRLIQRHTDQHIVSLNPAMCPCVTMNRIDLPHLLWTLESIAEGRPVNRISVPSQIATDARLTLDKMLALA